MNINNVSLSDSYQNLSFNGFKSKTAKSARTLINKKSLKDILNQKRKNPVTNIDDNDKFVFTYDKIEEDCKALNEKAALKKLLDSKVASLKAIVKQKEIDAKTCKTFLIERAKYQKEIYKKLIARCFEDFDNAILEKAPQEKLNKLADTTELFIRKFDHYDRPFK